MYLQKLVINDFGPIERLELDFEPGANSIQGENGRGKSHVMAAIRWLIDGHLPKANGWYLRGYGLGPRKAVVDSVWMHNGAELTIKRTLGVLSPGSPDSGEPPKVSSKAVLKHGDQHLRSVTDVNVYLQELTGLYHSHQFDSIFVEQGKATEPIVGMRAADRLKVFQYRAGVDVCQKAADAATRQLAAIDVVDRSEELKEQREQLEALRARLDAGVRKADGLAAEMAGMEVQAAQDLLRLDAEINGCKKTYADFCHNRDVLVPEIESATRSLAAAEQKLTQAREVVDSLGGEAAFIQANQLVAVAEQQNNLVRQKERLQQQIADLRQEYADHQAPEPPATPRDRIEVWAGELSTLQTQVSRAEEFLRVFAETGKCPTCGQAAPADQLQQYQAVVRDQRPLVDELAGRLSALRSEWAQYDAAEAAYQQWQGDFTRRSDELARRHAEMQVVQTVDQQKLDGAKKLIDSYKRAQQFVTDLTAAVERERKQADSLRQRLDSVQAEIGQLERRIAQAPAAEEVTKANELIAEYGRLNNKQAECRGAVKAMRDQLELAERTVKKLEGEQSGMEARARAVNLLNGIKRVFHHTALPQARIARYMQDVNCRMAKYCEWLHAPFSLYVEDGSLLFMAQFDDRAEPAFQLSGGQAMLAAWAFHLAEYEKHGSEFGLLCMDEPTVNLSDSNIAHVEGVIQRLNKYCAESNLQYITVTHEPTVAGCFSNVLTI